MAMRLLVVDDVEMNRDVLSRRLERTGYEVVTAEGGVEALRILAAQHVDLVLLDVMMPGMSGTEALLRMRETFTASQLPVIMVTAMAEDEGLVEAMHCGANDYITKPLNWEVALARIETRLALASTDRELRQTTELYRLASGASDESVWNWDVHKRSIYCSPRLRAILGCSCPAQGCREEEWLAHIHPGDRAQWRRQLTSQLEDQTALLETEFRARHTNGHYLWVECRASATRDAQGNPVRLVGHMTDITARRTVDPVTQLRNRVWLESELEVPPNGEEAAALVLVHLDGFDRCRGSLSEKQANRILQRATERIQGWLAIANLGGATFLASSAPQQFAVLVRRAASPEQLQQRVVSLKVALEEFFAEQDETAFVSVRLGIATAANGEEWPSLLRDGQAALHHSGEEGMRGITLFDSAMRQHDLEAMQLEADLRRAVERDQFLVFYQPKIDLEYGSIVGFEALVRWNRPGAGLVMPDDFIPLAERNGLIVPLGLKVLQRACEDTVELRKRFPQATVSVNVSGRQFSDPHLVQEVRRILDATGLDPKALWLEVTETVVVADPPAALATMRQFREMGVGLKLDDFGAGYSSLAYLKQFPFDTLKIDRCFIQGMNESAESRAIVRAIIEMARSLRLDTVAEGVESMEEAGQLRSMGCRFGQGYLFSRPVELPRLQELLESWRMPELLRVPQAPADALLGLPA
ncbi:MAG TPA: EAL domain-containing protein [Candidatus Sulfopaludibacter sp.]|jgi:PAS domain S-box-containing protein|nr:EAL domain-containing protein [Candidatus Sulfopaludibacter sp.]